MYDIHTEKKRNAQPGILHCNALHLSDPVGPFEIE
jgi:hypothetical protein